MRRVDAAGSNGGCRPQAKCLQGQDTVHGDGELPGGNASTPRGYCTAMKTHVSTPHGGGCSAAELTAFPVRYLVLWLTTACNLSCIYCYRGEQPVMAMPVAVARAALRATAGSGLPFHIQLAGGEPTLEPGLIETVGKIVRGEGWPATLAVQTNGTLLDARLIALCRHYGISVGISLDGPPAVQERTRGNAGAVFRGMDLLSGAEMAVRVTTVLSDANVIHLGELVLCLAAFPNVAGIGLDPLVRRGRAKEAAMPPPSEAVIRNGVRRMAAMVGQVNRLRSSPIRWREWDAVSHAPADNVGPQDYCHACRGESLAVHPSGTVYPCSQTVGDPAMAVGTVDHIDWAKLRGMFQGVRLTGDCQGCGLEGRCPGDCPSRLTYNAGATPKTMCVVYRTIAECLAGEEVA